MADIAVIGLGESLALVFFGDMPGAEEGIMSVTLLQLKTRARERADMVNSTFVTDAELISYINASVAGLHDMLIGAYNEEYFMTEAPLTSVGTVNIPLPADFYKLRGIDVRDSGRYNTVKRFNFNKRNDESFATELAGFTNLQYRLVGSNLRFNFAPPTGTVFRIFYHPKAAIMSVDADSFDDQNQYAEYVVLDVAIKMLNKEESDTSVLINDRNEQVARIMSMAQNRDANEPESVTDIYAEDGPLFAIRGS